MPCRCLLLGAAAVYDASRFAAPVEVNRNEMRKRSFNDPFWETLLVDGFHRDHFSWNCVCKRRLLKESRLLAANVSGYFTPEPRPLEGFHPWTADSLSLNTILYFLTSRNGYYGQSIVAYVQFRSVHSVPGDQPMKSSNHELSPPSKALIQGAELESAISSSGAATVDLSK